MRFRSQEVNEKDKSPEVLTRVKKRHSFLAKDEGEAEVSSYAMFTLGIAAFSFGFWAIACFSKAIIDQGPLAILKSLAEALLGK